MQSFPYTLAEVNPHWFVVFTDPEDGPQPGTRRDRCLTWALLAFLRPGFRHCYAMRLMHSSSGWLVVNPHAACTDVLEISFDSGIRQLTDAVQSGTAHVLCVRARRPQVWVPRLVMTCVASVAHVIGMPSTPWMTPYKLYRQLLQEDLEMGGIFSPSKPDTSQADAQAAEAKKEAEDLKKKNQATLNALRAGNTGRSLLTFGETGETGVKKTLGAG